MIVIIGEVKGKIKMTLFQGNLKHKIFSVVGKNEGDFFTHLGAKFKLQNDMDVFEKIREMEVHNGLYENSHGKKTFCNSVNENLKNKTIESIKKFIINLKKEKVPELVHS